MPWQEQAPPQTETAAAAPGAAIPGNAPQHANPLPPESVGVERFDDRLGEALATAVRSRAAENPGAALQRALGTADTVAAGAVLQRLIGPQPGQTLTVSGNIALDQQAVDHITQRHHPTTGQAARFWWTAWNDLNDMMEEAVTDGQVVADPQNRAGSRYELTYNDQIGGSNRRPLYTLRVIVDANDYVVTAMPVRG